ncbi:MAG TPA: hypothetical protein VLW54_01950 [Candidatus Acidoferrales bacterium]|nr:hypothetical protein [Candidatus Acidoferrales bacterium]
MWYVNERFTKEQMDALPRAGFAVNATGGVVRVERYGCGAEFRRTPEGRFEMTELPTIISGGLFTRLWDAGYQKFLLRSDGKKVPAHAEQLLNLRKFNEDLRSVLGLHTFYNEALGSVCEISEYDRVKGRAGDVPDEGVGAKSEAAH